MADEMSGIDITHDLNGQGDAVPYGGGKDIPQNQLPTSLPDKEPSAPEPELSTREMLTQAFKAQQGAAQPDPAGARPAANSDQTQTAAQPGSPAPQAAPATLIKVGERWHKPDGTFASQADIEAFNAAQAAPPQPEAPAPPPPAFFNRLTPVEQQQFTSLPQEVRQFVERTMEGVNQREQQYQEYASLEQELVGPRRQAWASNGMTPLVALNNLLNISDMAGRDPAQFVLWFAGQHNLDLDQILDDRDANQQPADPRYQGLQQEIASLRTTIEGFTNQNVQTSHAQNLKLVQDFAAEKDTAGALAFPYFAEVANDMMPYVQSIRQQQPYLDGREALKAAYDFACFNNPGIRAKLQEGQLAALKASASAEAAKAQQAGLSINGAPNGDARHNTANVSSNRSAVDDVRDVVRQQMN